VVERLKKILFRLSSTLKIDTAVIKGLLRLGSERPQVRILPFTLIWWR